jgi:hypothetical protein
MNGQVISINYLPYTKLLLRFFHFELEKLCLFGEVPPKRSDKKTPGRKKPVMMNEKPLLVVWPTGALKREREHYGTQEHCNRPDMQRSTRRAQEHYRAQMEQGLITDLSRK